jgi:hypothetical protein
MPGAMIDRSVEVEIGKAVIFIPKGEKTASRFIAPY